MKSDEKKPENEFADSILGITEFEMPKDGEQRSEVEEFKEKVNERLHEFVSHFIALNPWDFIVLKERVVNERNIREIARIAYFPFGRMGIHAKCVELANKFPMFKAQLMAGMEQESKT